MVSYVSCNFFSKLTFSKISFRNTIRVSNGLDLDQDRHFVGPGPEVIKLFPCTTQLSMKFFLLINVKMPTIVGIFTFISMVNTTFERLKAKKISFVGIIAFMSS